MIKRCNKRLPRLTVEGLCFLGSLLAREANVCLTELPGRDNPKDPKEPTIMGDDECEPSSITCDGTAKVRCHSSSR
jgi:hypothetical protein